MASKIEICNFALGYIGKQSIAALTENTESARRVNQFYDVTRDAVLRDYPWAFAKKEVALAISTGDTAVKWQFVYQYPAGCAKVRRLYADPATAPTYNTTLRNVQSLLDDTDEVPWDMLKINSSLKIVTDLENAYAEITEIVTDPSLYDPQFVKAFGYALAAELAIPLTKSPTIQAAMMKIYGTVLPAAQASTANERKNTPQYSSRYARGRW